MHFFNSNPSFSSRLDWKIDLDIRGKQKPTNVLDSVTTYMHTYLTN